MMIGKIILGVYILMVLLSLFNFIAAFQETGRIMKQRGIKHRKKTFFEKVVSAFRVIFTVGFWSIIPIFNMLVSSQVVNMDNIIQIVDKA